MTSSELDTSGAVTLSAKCYGPDNTHSWISQQWYWSDLNAFRQGYVAAAFDTVLLEIDAPIRNWRKFGDLAPETLAAMLKDCEAFTADPERANYSGRLFWERRQLGHLKAFPPLALTLGADGKIHQEPRP